MKERIKAIMDAEEFTPARFADTLEIGRAIVSHILNGRNNPSLDVITRILTKIPQISPEWLLTGKGNMYKADNIEQSLQTTASSVNESLQGALFPDLFSQTVPESSLNPINLSGETEYPKENIVERSQHEVLNSNNERIIYKEAPVRKIKQIIIYYTDNTFEAFDRP